MARQKTQKSFREKVSKSQPAELLTSDIDEDIREFKKEVRKGQRWVIERRRFFIKLAIVAGMIAILLIYSHFVLRV